MTTSSPPTVADYLRGLGVTNPDLHGLAAHLTDQYRSAHLGVHDTDPGDLVPDVRLADRVMELTTITVCRLCEARQPEDADGDPCNFCGPIPAPAWVMYPSQPLPVSLGGDPNKRCVNCGETFTPDAYYVERRLNPVQTAPACPSCARTTPETVAWQAACDITAAIDKAMQQAVDRRQRQQIAAHLAQVASHFAGWRWPVEQEAR
ncbi:hypothetical protein [Micromonospora carbonacea]|uniref:hypothetical protein n=1 Tax=Micromonospora carbonacea TaxID=47853 RepID=UPI00371B6A1F